MKETVKGIVLTTNALLYDLVRCAISCCAGGTVIAGGVGLGWSMLTPGIGTGSMPTLRAGTPLIALGGSAGGVAASGGMIWLSGAKSVALAFRASMVWRLSMSSS